MKRSAFFLLIFSFLISTRAFGEVYGILEDGGKELKLSRKGKFISAEELNPGVKVYPYDVIRTGAEGFADFLVKTFSGNTVEIRVGGDSIFFLEQEITKREQITGINLIAGSIQSRFTNQERHDGFVIKSGDFSVAAGKDRASFTVHRAVDSSILVTCRDGKVLCQDKRGCYSLGPGTIYEIDEQGHGVVLSLSVDETGSYTFEWQRKHKEGLKSRCGLLLEYYTELYLQTAPVFLEAFNELKTRQELFYKWEDITEHRQIVSMSEATRDKIALSNGMIRLRSTLPSMERIFYSIQFLAGGTKSDLDEAGLTETARKILAIYEKRKKEFEKKLTQARYFFRIFMEMDRQSSGQNLMPSSELVNSTLLNDSFFIMPPSP